MNSQQMGERKANLCDPKPDQSQQGERSQAHSPTPDCEVIDDHELLRGRFLQDYGLQQVKHSPKEEHTSKSVWMASICLSGFYFL